MDEETVEDARLPEGLYCDYSADGATLMSVMQEFREFAVRGSVVDMAVGIVIGAAFTKIVSSLVADIITPVLGLLSGSADFGDLSLTLRAAAGDRPPLVLSYGNFIQSILDFLLVGIAIFLVVKGINRLRRQEDQKKTQATT